MNGQKVRLVLEFILISLLGVNGALGCPNDNCNQAEAVGNVTNLTFDTRDARFDGPGHCMVSPNCWYCYTATCTGEVTVSLLGSSFDTMLAVYRGCNCYPAGSDMIECNDDAAGSHQSQITFSAMEGEQFLIEVGGYGFQTGQGILNITCEGETPAPKDDCAQAIAVGEVADLEFDTTEATFDGPGICLVSPNIWYCYTASCTGEATVSLLGSGFDTMLAVYNGCGCDPVQSDLIGCNDDAGGTYQSELTFEVTSGQSYLIEIGAYGSGTGQGVLNITCEGEEPPPATKDDCENATPIGEVKDLEFNTMNATFDGEGLCLTSPNVWYCYTASCSGEVTVSLMGSAYDTKLAVYDGCGCELKQGNLIECNDDAGGTYQSEVTFTAVEGQEYLIEIGGYGSQTGEGILNVSCEGSGSSNNDNCDNAQDIGDVKDLAFDTTEASFDGPGLCLTSPNLWYRYTATCTGEATISLCGSAFDTMLAVYKGGDCYPSAGGMIGCNDDACGYQSELVVEVIAGGVYLIEVGGYGNQTGQGILNVSCQSEVPTEPYDLGDAPDSTNNTAGKEMSAYPSQGLLPVLVHAKFPTVYDDGTDAGPIGPVHLRAGEVAFLGSTVTWESEADSGNDQDGLFNIQPENNTADQDDGDDGVVFPVSFLNCRWSSFNYQVNVVEPDTDLWVNVWCDWNRDGDWDDTIECTQGVAKEWAVQNQLLFDLPAGTHTIMTPGIFAWHPPQGPEEIWMRITLSEQPWKGGSNPGEEGNAGSGPLDGYDIGETEDYYFAPDTSMEICEDFNGDGVINTSDLVTFTSMWLESCPD